MDKISNDSDKIMLKMKDLSNDGSKNEENVKELNNQLNNFKT
jgi:hypothetical protein